MNSKLFMKKEPRIFLQHIIESIEAIERYMKGVSKEKFCQNQQKQDAVVRRIEIIGEAVKNLPLNFRKKYPQVNWREAAGMRDVVVHEYFGVDISIVWRTIEKDLPIFKKQILEIIEKIGGQIDLPMK